MTCGLPWTVVLPVLLAPLVAQAQRSLPGPGSDTFESVMDVVLVIGASQEVVRDRGSAAKAGQAYVMAEPYVSRSR